MSRSGEFLYSKSLLKKLVEDADLPDEDLSTDFRPENVARASDYCPAHDNLMCSECHPITPRESVPRPSKTAALRYIQDACAQPVRSGRRQQRRQR
jgi:hypothetical protein